MLSNAKIKWVRSLHHKKFRRKEAVFLAEGEKIAREVMESNIPIAAVFATQTWVEKNQECKAASIYTVSQTELQRISTLATPNEVLLVLEATDVVSPPLPEKNDLFLMLDTIQDPGNMGTILRTADWFGVKNVICSNDSADLYNPKVIQATMGAFVRVKVYYTNLYAYLSDLKNVPVMGAVLDGMDIYKNPLPQSGLLVIGNESKGISDELLPLLNTKLFIPRFNGSAHVPESLNASVATAIFLSQLKQ